MQKIRTQKLQFTLTSLYDSQKKIQKLMKKKKSDSNIKTKQKNTNIDN